MSLVSPPVPATKSPLMIMYNQGYGTTSSELTNNPFVNDPTNPSTRYPDISGSITSPAGQGLPPGQFTSWLQPGAVNTNPTAVPVQPSMYQQPSFQQPQPPPFSTGYSPQMNPISPMQAITPQQTSQPFQPTSSFGQQLAGQVSGSSYGYLHGQSTGMPQTGYNPAQQQLQNNPGYIAQFDPYASISQGWDGQTQNQNQNQNQNQQVQSPTQSTFSTSAPTSSSGNPHPREYIRTHKAELESWDNYAWKQLLNAFDALKDAWGARKKELEGKIGQLQMQLQYGGGGYYPGQIQQEGSRLQGLVKESDSNFDSVAASSFQMHEVFNGYRQSGDHASKRRVREASNAALQSLPDWPAQTY